MHCKLCKLPTAPPSTLTTLTDLKKENVLLKSERRDRRGYVCKLGDFGLSRCGQGGGSGWGAGFWWAGLDRGQTWTGL